MDSALKRDAGNAILDTASANCAAFKGPTWSSYNNRFMESMQDTVVRRPLLDKCMLRNYIHQFALCIKDGIPSVPLLIH